MTVTLNHTIIHASNPEASAAWYAATLGLAAPRKAGPFHIVDVGPTSLDFIASGGAVASRHFAFLVSEDDFDEIFVRATANGADYWADPARKHKGEINRWDDGRGFYFLDPDGHFLEVITRPYGSGGLGAKHVNPLLKR